MIVVIPMQHLRNVFFSSQNQDNFQLRELDNLEKTIIELNRLAVLVILILPYIATCIGGEGDPGG